MSIVIAIAYKNTVIIKSDGRARSTQTGEILSERCNKTDRISSNVICGFTGHYNAGLQALREFKETYCDLLEQASTENLVEALHDITTQLLTNHPESLKVAFVVGGFDPDGAPVLYSWKNLGRVSVHRPLSVADISYVFLNPDDYSGDLRKLLDRYLRIYKMNFHKAMDACIREVAKNCDSVNSSIFQRSLSRR